MYERIHRSPYPDRLIPQRLTFTQYLLQNSTGKPDNPCYIDGKTGKTITFAGVKRDIYKVASALHALLEVKKGETAAIVSPNHLHYPIIVHAFGELGGIVACVNPIYTDREVRHHLVDSKASYIITYVDLLPRLVPLAKELALKRVIAMTPLDQAVDVPSHDGFVVTFDHLLEKGDGKMPHIHINPMEDVFLMPYSSGTTGLPKGVMLTHFNSIANIVQAGPFEDTGHNDATVGLLPFFHVFGGTIALCHIRGPGPLVIIQRYDFEEFLQIIEKYKVTHAGLVPPIVVSFAKNPLTKKYNLSSLRNILCGAAGLGGDVLEFVQEQLGCTMKQGYGMTELTAGAIACGLRDRVGRSIPHA